MPSVLFLCEKICENTPVVQSMKTQFSSEIMGFSSKAVSSFCQNHPKDFIAVYLKDLSVNSQKELLFLLSENVGIPFILIGNREDCKYYYEKASGQVKNCIFFPFALHDFMARFAELINEVSSEPFLFPDIIKKHVLVVDDDPIYLRTMMNWLKEKYSISVVKSGKAALDFLFKEIPDIILLDYEMPEMNGLQTLEKIRSRPSWQKIPVVFLTGVTDSSMVKNAVSQKPQGYVLKNINQAGLLSKIEEVLKQSSLS